MLSPEEFTVGTLGDAQPLSLILPRKAYEATMLVGWRDDEPTAVILSGQYAFHYFPSVGNDNWKGLIVPKVRIEMDEASLFDPNEASGKLGDLIRLDARLAIRAKSENSYGPSAAVTLYGDLPPAGEWRAGFSKWQVVIGEGANKRILWQTSNEA